MGIWCFGYFDRVGCVCLCWFVMVGRNLSNLSNLSKISNFCVFSLKLVLVWARCRHGFPDAMVTLLVIEEVYLGMMGTTLLLP